MHPAVKTHNDANAVAAEQRAGLILKYRAAKMSWASIAEELQIAESSARRLYRTERERLQAERTNQIADIVDEELDGLDALEASANTIALTAKTTGERLKAMNVVLSVKKQRAALLGLNAPERHVLFPGMPGSGQVDPGRDIPREELEQMSDEALVALESGHRTAMLRVIETTAEERTGAEIFEDDEDDGAPPELDITDPGPHAAFPADAGEDRADSTPEDEGSERSE
jgi:hypothetical protein